MFWLVALSVWFFVSYIILCRYAYKQSYKEGYKIGYQMGYEDGELDYLEELDALEQQRKANRRATIQKITHLKVVK